MLVPVALADTLLRIAEKGLYRPLWSDRILTEAQEAIEEIHPGIDVTKRFAGMRHAFDDALVTGWEGIESRIVVQTRTTGTSMQQQYAAAHRRSLPQISMIFPSLHSVRWGCKRSTPMHFSWTSSTSARRPSCR